MRHYRNGVARNELRATDRPYPAIPDGRLSHGDSGSALPGGKLAGESEDCCCSWRSGHSVHRHAPRYYKIRAMPESMAGRTARVRMWGKSE